MKDKKKRINELGNTLYNRQDKYDLSNPFEVAKCVIDLGYQKLPEDSVVLSREEYNETLEQFRQEIITLSQELVNSRKETAEKILKDIMFCIDINDCNKNEMLILNLCKMLAKQFSVEIKE